ncbi:MAG: M20/M25/M40 family metallo-hydrolase [Acutalibacteraceae bacterium]
MDYNLVKQKAKTDVKILTDFSVEKIRDICKKFGPRPCGEESEKSAQEYLVDELKPYCDSVWRELFKCNPDAFMSFVPFAGGCLLASSALNLLGAHKNKKLSFASLGLVATAVSALVGEFLFYKKPLDPFFPEKESGNVVSVRKASGETKKRIILSGHTDSAPEWTYTYKLGSSGSFIVAGPAIVGLLHNIAVSAANLTSKNPAFKKKFALSQLAFSPAFSALFKFTNNKRYVEGANDDLTGTLIAASVMKYLSDNDIRFENTEVIALLTGGEEAGLRGSKAFFEAHPELKDDSVETVFIGIDTIRDEEFMEIYNKDMTGMVKNSDEVSLLLQNAAKKCGKDVPIGAIPLGSTDAAAASQAGIKATSIVAMDPAPARYYHTRLDTHDILEPKTIEKTIEIILQAVFDFDEK